MDEKDSIFFNFQGKSEENIKMPEPDHPKQKAIFYFHGWEGESMLEAKNVREKMLRRCELLMFRKKILSREEKKYRQQVAIKRKAQVPDRGCQMNRKRFHFVDWEGYSLEKAKPFVQKEDIKSLALAVREIYRNCTENGPTGINLLFVCAVLGSLK